MLRNFLRLFVAFRELENKATKLDYILTHEARPRIHQLESQLTTSQHLQSEWQKTADDFHDKLSRAEDDVREWKDCSERHLDDAQSSDHLRTEADAALAATREHAAEWKTLFLAEKAAHQQALELLADWQGQRLMGRSIFHHAPLLQPEKPATREKVPVPKSGRDLVREETKAFEERARTIEQTIQRNKRSQAQANHPTLTAERAEDLSDKEQAAFFDGVLNSYKPPTNEPGA